jgi:uncharacterized protein YndB with AHSA1/START domain
MADDLLPVEKRLHVRLPPSAAFDLFTRDLSLWWPFATHSCAGADALRANFSTQTGGQVVEEARDGRRHVWGTLLAWEPPHRFAMTWHPGTDPAHATRLEVCFAAADNGGTLLQLRHDGWAKRPDGDGARGRYDHGWDIVLERYTDAAGGASR